MNKVPETISDALKTGISAHRDGLLSQAKNCYELILASINASDVDDIEIKFSLADITNSLLSIVDFQQSSIGDFANATYENLKFLDRGRSGNFLESPTSCILQIHSWEGRIGHNLRTLANAILTTQMTNSCLLLTNHGLLDFSKIGYTVNCLQNPTSVNTPNLKLRFNGLDNWGITASINQIRDILQPLPREILRFQEDKDITQDTLVIHLRSGDVFAANIGEGWFQPPLSFYQKTIEHANCQKIVLVSESHNLNPCATRLLQEYQGILDIRLQCGSLNDDINTILSANNLVLSKSAFAKHLACFSNNIKNLYNFWDDSSEYVDIPDINVITGTAEGYPGEISWSDWSRSIPLMVEYPKDKIVFQNN